MTKKATPQSNLNPKLAEQAAKYEAVMRKRSDMTKAQQDAAIEKYVTRISTPVTQH